jgi:hypothetical protein
MNNKKKEQRIDLIANPLARNLGLGSRAAKVTAGEPANGSTRRE